LEFAYIGTFMPGRYFDMPPGPRFFHGDGPPGPFNPNGDPLKIKVHFILFDLVTREYEGVHSLLSLDPITGIAEFLIGTRRVPFYVHRYEGTKIVYGRFLD
jgi:hypothetical protein